LKCLIKVTPFSKIWTLLATGTPRCDVELSEKSSNGTHHIKVLTESDINLTISFQQI
jgi:hypothetical protein